MAQILQLNSTQLNSTQLNSTLFFKNLNNYFVYKGRLHGLPFLFLPVVEKLEGEKR